MTRTTPSCEGCGKTATHISTDDVDLCAECYSAIPVTPHVFRKDGRCAACDMPAELSGDEVDSGCSAPKESLVELVDEVADAVKANRSMGVGEESIGTLLRERFRDRLFDALLSDIPVEPVAPELLARIEKERQRVRADASREAPAAMTSDHVDDFAKILSDHLPLDRELLWESGHEILAHLQAQVSGDSVSVPRSELESLLAYAVKVRRGYKQSISDGTIEMIVSRWLSSSLPSAGTKR